MAPYIENIDSRRLGIVTLSILALTSTALLLGACDKPVAGSGPLPTPAVTSTPSPETTPMPTPHAAIFEPTLPPPPSEAPSNIQVLSFVLNEKNTGIPVVNQTGTSPMPNGKNPTLSPAEQHEAKMNARGEEMRVEMLGAFNNAIKVDDNGKLISQDAIKLPSWSWVQNGVIKNTFIGGISDNKGFVSGVIEDKDGTVRMYGFTAFDENGKTKNIDLINTNPELIAKQGLKYYFGDDGLLYQGKEDPKGQRFVVEKINGEQVEHSETFVTASLVFNPFSGKWEIPTPQVTVIGQSGAGGATTTVPSTPDVATPTATETLPVFSTRGTMSSSDGKLTASVPDSVLDVAGIESVSIAPEKLTQVKEYILVTWAGQMAKSDEAVKKNPTLAMFKTVFNNQTMENPSPLSLEQMLKIYDDNTKLGENGFQYEFDFGSNVKGKVDKIDIKTTATEGEWQAVIKNVQGKNIPYTIDQLPSSPTKSLFYFENDTLKIYESSNYANILTKKASGVYFSVEFSTGLNSGKDKIGQNLRSETIFNSDMMFKLLDCANCKIDNQETGAFEVTFKK